MPSVIWTETGTFSRQNYKSETDLENTILIVQEQLFGQNRIYLDVKKKIGLRGKQRNIPDGYLIDLSSSSPRLYVVENELSTHDLLRHIAVQILQLSLSFESELRLIRNILFDAIQHRPDMKYLCQQYMSLHNFRNLDHLIDTLVFNSPFAALVIIDEMPEDLENVLVRKFQFGVEVLELARYENEHGDYIYQFKPFLEDVYADVTAASISRKSDVGISEIDTVVVPAREEGFTETFLGENRWHAVRIHGTMRPQIKYIAVYQVAPISAITHIGEVQSIEPWGDAGKVVINLMRPAQELTPIPMNKKGKVKSFQNLRYTSLKNLETAKSLDDLW